MPPDLEAGYWFHLVKIYSMILFSRMPSGMGKTLLTNEQLHNCSDGGNEPPKPGTHKSDSGTHRSFQSNIHAQSKRHFIIIALNVERTIKSIFRENRQRNTAANESILYIQPKRVTGQLDSWRNSKTRWTKRC